MGSLAQVNTLAQAVKEGRRWLGLSQKELAYCAGCSVKMIEKIESGERRPSRQIADLLASCLRIEEDERAAFLELARNPLPARQGAPEPNSHIPSIPSIPSIPNNLPAPATPFVGREREVDEACSMLLGEEVRLLTFSGPPGIGKTRLGLRVASQLLPHFSDGVFFVPLATVHDAGAVPEAIAHSLRLDIGEERSVTEIVESSLRGKQVLLVLDNFERITSAGPLVAALLSLAAGLKVITTSREPLHLYGEYEFEVPPLALPPLSQLPAIEQIADYEAISLFMERARAAKRDFRITDDNAPDVAAICTRLDGLALAIELAAARIRHYSPSDISRLLASRLDLLVGGPVDLPPRQQTLRAAIDWSYDLLDPEEQATFRRLSLFSGGCEAEAADEVCNDPDVKRVLISLADKSLLRVEESETSAPRYTMLETIREYAAHKLAQNGEQVVTGKRHAAYFLSLAERANSRIRAAEGAEWLARLEREHDNMRDALSWAIETADASAALRLASALRWFWYLRGYVAEGQRWLDEALSIKEQPPRERAEALTALGVLAERLGNQAAATSALEESLALWHNLGDATGTAKALHNLAGVALEHGEYDRAEELYKQGLELWRALGDTRNIGATLHNLSLIVYSRGDYEQALAICREALPIMESEGDVTFVARLLTTVGEILRLQGNYRQAGDYYRRSLEMASRVGDLRGMSLALVNIGAVERRTGDLERAESYLKEALNIDLEAGDRANVAQDLVALAGIVNSKGRPEQAARLFSAATALLEELGVKLSGPDLLEYEMDLAETRAKLPRSVWAKLEAEGRMLPTDEAVKHAFAD